MAYFKKNSIAASVRFDTPGYREHQTAIASSITYHLKTKLTADVDGVISWQDTVEGPDVGLKDGHELYGRYVHMIGKATDNGQGQYGGYIVGATVNGSSAKFRGYTGGLGLTALMSSFSGDIYFHDYSVTIKPLRKQVGSGDSITVSGGDALHSTNPLPGGDYIIKGGSGINGGADGTVKVHDMQFLTGAKVTTIKTSVGASPTDTELVTALGIKNNLLGKMSRTPVSIAPTGPTGTGVQGDWYDDGALYFYLCVATNVWIRLAAARVW